MKALLFAGNTLIPSEIAKYRGHEDVRFQLNILDI